MTRSLSIFLPCFSLIGLWGCGLQRHQEYILPEGFTGLILIWQDPSATTELTVKGRTVTIRVPHSGILPILDDDHLYGPHTTSVRFEDGPALDWDTIPGYRGRPDQVRFWILGSASGTDFPGDPTHVYFVGTESGAREAWGLDPIGLKSEAQQDSDANAEKPPGVERTR